MPRQVCIEYPGAIHHGMARGNRREAVVLDDENNPLFPALRSGPTAGSGASLQKQIPSACESARLLLNSKSALFPNGAGNSSGKVGKYIMDTVGADLSGQIPVLENMPPHNEDGAGGSHSYSPWWLYKEQLAGKLDFARGYHIEMGGSRHYPSVGSFNGLEHYTGGSYGAKLKEDARRYYGSFVGYSGRGEMIPNDDCYCEIDNEVKDKWGIPVLKFH